MKLRFNSVSTRLFLAIFATCILLVVIMHQGVRMSFQHGFIDYIRENDQQRTELIADALAEQYDETGSWRFLIRNERAFFHILRSIEHHQRALPPTKPKGWRSYFWVYDSQDQLILGRDVPLPDDVIRQPVVTSNGKTVGWVIASSGDGISSEIDRRFDEQQMLTSWLIAGLSLVVALIATLLLARGFLKPIKRLLYGTNQLANGDFSIRVAEVGHDELGQLAKDFNHLASTLEKNEQMRRDYMADISHELRTPLSVLQGELEAVQDGVRKATPETINSLLAETQTLIKLVNDLHQLSLSDRGSLVYRIQSADIIPLIDMTIGQAHWRLEEKQLTVEANLPQQQIINIDPDRILQLFYNLMENSLRYTDPLGKIVIRATVENDQFSLYWEDSAPGLTAQQCSHLFERFYRAEESRSRASGGSGLGLAICYNIIEAHKGSIHASPSSLGGVCIAIHLPLNQKENEQ
ncbi:MULTISPECIES: two-component system sensor histidine kinase BaeS [Providencia]|uniref:histidine kinase n=1 Tax=Providencia stuartii TaxID=588 RepID=A0AAI9HW84_PROST|nr:MULTISPECIES: two-component system sensor histidine kinase BaeS [Providencia]ELR5043950.1 two-component system sensor histidine kinase BaeS [Providencia rettgeri]ELR5033913.1 two-component system sensor histidine kinase BaeS [Providencia stuartii]ELR5290823.1 two-component system sensor histidine kinase BaeS [Providencia stuartii]MBG5918561.1 two-component system sensor histidine kinase BaeS [Providencia stuartii]MCR4179337.1 two-component system sensor histidine kinase BaeS [Providencia ve